MSRCWYEISLSELRNIAANRGLWLNYWDHFTLSAPAEYSESGGIARRLTLLLEHQHFMKLFHSTVKAEKKVIKQAAKSSDILTPREVQELLKNSNLWYAYVEKHSYFKPQSFVKLSMAEKLDLINNHQQMLREGRGEINVFKTEEERVAAGPDTNQNLIQKGEFAMLFVEGGCIPQHLHFTEESLNKEADRLARDTKKKVFILRPVEVREVELAPINCKTLIFEAPSAE